jgi:hypothetical protein
LLCEANQRITWLNGDLERHQGGGGWLSIRYSPFRWNGGTGWDQSYGWPHGRYGGRCGRVE